MNNNIHFHLEGVSFRLRSIKAIKLWLNSAAKTEKNTIDTLNVIFCSDEYLLGINKKYLNHDYYTDIITFDNSDNQNVSGDLFISYDRIKENANNFSIPISNELHRVVIHGLLHLLGYNDKTTTQKQEMKSKEDFYLSLRSF